MLRAAVEVVGTCETRRGVAWRGVISKRETPMHGDHRRLATFFSTQRRLSAVWQAMRHWATVDLSRSSTNYMIVESSATGHARQFDSTWYAFDLTRTAV